VNSFLLFSTEHPIGINDSIQGHSNLFFKVSCGFTDVEFCNYLTFLSDSRRTFQDISLLEEVERAKEQTFGQKANFSKRVSSEQYGAIQYPIKMAPWMTLFPHL